MRSAITGIGTTNGRIETWHNNKKIIDFSNVDLTTSGFLNQHQFDSFYMNRFANILQAQPGSPAAIDHTVWDAIDNYVLETWSASECAADPANCGKPLTCAQIGFNGISNPPPTDSYPSVSVSASPTTLTVGSAVSLSASASDDKGVLGVQFKVDGVNQGSEDTTSPYTLSFTPTAGNHSITAVARDTIGQTTTSNPVTITVNTVNLCGNGTINSGEQCDGTNLGGQSCTSFGFTGGTLSCNTSCQLVTNSCTGGTAPAGVTASYSFDNSAADISGNGNGGTPTNGPTYTTGHSNQALLFDGIDDYVDIGDKLNLTVPFTVAAWVRLDSGASGDPVIFATDDDANYTGFKLFVEGGGVNTFGVDLMNGGAPGPGSRSTKLATTPLSYGTWTHVAAVVNGVGNVTLYQNGQPVSGTTSGSATTMVHTSSPASIGRRNGNNWKGAIDDLNIYTKALSASEVQALASGTGAASITSLSLTTPSLETNLTGTGRLFTVSFYTPGQTNALSTISITGTAGSLTFTPTSLNPGSYDVSIKTNKYLSRRKTNLTLANSTNLGSFSSLYTGDLDGNNTINSLDWSLMNNVWFTNSPANDLNEDGIVNSLDRALLIRNWFRQGE
jgi:hypothetical protein